MTVFLLHRGQRAGGASSRRLEATPYVVVIHLVESFSSLLTTVADHDRPMVTEATLNGMPTYTIHTQVHYTWDDSSVKCRSTRIQRNAFRCVALVENAEYKTQM